ncbi:ABC transporter permease [Amnibacterium sp. CER49]|uniref:ABC transporter permease n=1 Tax=Amnibacterium sp. CER49 TaxID=3039161 RepID=UPI002449809F|nr:ABC transporter permease [Amnibacterium sp. CER49]MDH2442930.1 ABC transporter permease [Amnibacterium sp. CER49]
MNQTTAPAVGPATPAEPGTAAAPEATAAKRPARPLKDRLQTISLLAALVILPAIFTALNPQFLSGGNIDSMLQQTSILLLVVVAGTGPILMGSIDLSVGAIVSLTAVFAGLAAQALGQPAVFLVIPLGLLVGLLNGAIIAYLRLPSFLVTLGTSFAISGIALLASGGFPVQLPAGPLTPMFNKSLLGLVPLPLVYAVVVWAVMIIWLRRTATGRFVYAIGGNERASGVLGVRVRWVKTLTFGVSGLCCGIAGIALLFSTTAATSEVGNAFLLPSIAAIVMGGTPLSGGQGGAGRGLIGTLLLVELGNGMLILGFSPAAQQIVQGLVVVLAVLLTLDRRRLQIVK